MVDHAAVDGAAGYLRHVGAVDHVDEGRAQVEGFPVFIEGEVVHAPDETGGRLQEAPCVWSTSVTGIRWISEASLRAVSSR